MAESVQTPKILFIHKTEYYKFVKEQITKYFGYKKYTELLYCTETYTDFDVNNQAVVCFSMFKNQYYIHDKNVLNVVIVEKDTKMENVKIMVNASNYIVGHIEQIRDKVNEWICNRRNEILARKPIKVETSPEPAPERYDWSKHDMTKFNDFVQKKDIMVLAGVDKQYLARSKTLNEVKIVLHILAVHSLTTQSKVSTNYGDMLIDCCDFFGCTCTKQDDGIYLMHF